MVNNLISIPLGIIIGLLASFVQSLGLTIQRKSHVINQSLPDHQQTVEHRRPLWLLGFAIFISSNILGSFVQIASLPVVILAPLGAVSLLWNAFFARLLLGDVFSPWMILGTILIAGGAILIAFFGIVPEQTRSLEDLLKLFHRPAFIAYFSVLGFIVFACLAATHLSEYALSRRLSSSCPKDIPIPPPTAAPELTTGISDAITEATLPTEPVDPKYSVISPSNSSIDNDQLSQRELRSANRTRLLLAISYASFSGIISGMCLIFAKSGVELLLLTFGGDNQFWRWESWLLVVALIIFALLQLWYLHKALILANPTLVCPSAFCFYNLSSIVNGLVYYDQFALIPPLHLGLVVVGIVILLCGVWVVSIQPGGGAGVDFGPWGEDGVALDGDDVALYSGISTPSEGEDQATEGRPSGPAPLIDRTHEGGNPPTSRETQSEGDIHHHSTKRIDREQADDTQEAGSPQKVQNGAQLYSTPRRPSQSRHRRLTLETQHPSSSSNHGRTLSYPQPGHPHPHTPSNLTSSVSSHLSTGFQIGLSPLSPGFTIVPLERRGRGSVHHTFADVAADVTDSVHHRRRTVSEGERISQAPVGPEVEVDADPEQGGSQHVSRATFPPLQDDGELQVGAGSGNGRHRWRWLRSVFTGKRRS